MGFFCTCYDSPCLWCLEILLSLWRFPLFPSRSSSAPGRAQWCPNLPELVHACFFFGDIVLCFCNWSTCIWSLDSDIVYNIRLQDTSYLASVVVVGWRRKENSGKLVHQCNAGVSIIFKIRVFYKAWFEGFEFLIKWPFAVFHKMQVVFYKSVHFMYLWSINSVFAKCDLQSSKILK